jgi:hypothetical protein
MSTVPDTFVMETGTRRPSVPRLLVARPSRTRGPRAQAAGDRRETHQKRTGDIPGRSGRPGARIAARGGNSAGKRAVIAMARKLAVTLLALWKSGAAYHPLPQGA